MKRFSVLVLISLIITYCQAQSKESSLTVIGFEQAINISGVQLLDVRTAAEYNSGHLRKSLQADWYNQQQFKDRTQHLDKSKPLYVYCQTGIRSAATVKLLKKNGFINVQDMKGGLIAWKKTDKPVEGAIKVIQLTLRDYNEQISSSNTVLVDFGASWCPPCRKMEPIITQLKNGSANRYSVVNIDAATQTDLLKQLNIEALPVFIVYKNGKEVWRKQGIVTLEELKSKLL